MGGRASGLENTLEQSRFNDGEWVGSYGLAQRFGPVSLLFQGENRMRGRLRLPAVNLLSFA